MVATGHTGIVSDLAFHQKFVIYGGTVVAKGSGADIAAFHDFVIYGGSVNAREFAGGYPKDGNGNNVYLVTVTVGDPSVKNTEVTCSVNGGTPFTCITDDQGKLYLWMPEGQGSTKIDAGGTIYRASGAVEANYENVMLAQRDPIVTEALVTPTSTTAVRGSTVQFSARVEGQYNPPQTVTWTVENAHQGTTIDASGLLTISTDESSQNVLVTATSTYDTSKSGTAEVAVPSVTGVVVTPANATALSGTTVQFSALVEGQYNPPQTVTWTVENAHQGTTIDDSGLLVISVYESSRTLQATATSAYDSSKSGAAQVTVISTIAIGYCFSSFCLSCFSRW